MLSKICEGVTPLAKEAMQTAQKRWDTIAKPLNSLGKLEQIIIKIAGITGDPYWKLDKRAVVVMGADNGVIEEGVTQTGNEVTALVMQNLCRKTAAVSYFAAKAQADVFPVDIGIATNLTEKGIIDYKIARGTHNIAKEAAMSRQEAIKAVTIGIKMVERLKKDGYQIIAVGEMGIGNTTTTSAVACALLGISPQAAVGRGAGLSSEGLRKKIAVVTQALAINKPDSTDGLDVLAKVGGFDLAGLAGLFLGGAYYHIPMIMDGVISQAAALAAVRICSQIKPYLLPSHLSKEPVSRLLLQELALSPIIDGELCLGEGTGAVLLLPILDMAEAIYQEMDSFEQMRMAAYQPLL